ncbi:hypothetical protein RVR_8336 [Actinacidiphila reveromycinica]|uniref:Peptidase C1A papain C-terminal domain-containing protein n=1 Tax=Actinacidiphila reveromycinica TaxID=659352 RepID=A0A7U3VRS8_9ACTN|nr:C1 family peptidase [Streptomyces sp. SN-593]BBB01084.1 hypothetical protein RVR_8336 [Streptomyces sp. SN-593]
MTVHRHRYTPTDPRLGRHIAHDERSRAFAHPEMDASQLQAVEWTRRIPILNQGQVGSCTGNALTGVIGTDSAERMASPVVQLRADKKKVFKAGSYRLDESTALKFYSLNTREDDCDGTYPPDDTGSSSLAAGKSGKAVGLFSGYLHAFSLLAMQTALQQGAVLIGIPWYQSMFTPKTDGTLDVDPSSGVAGGHELAVSGWDKDRFKVDNSWGGPWGDHGSCYVTNQQMQQFLADGGDCLAPKWAER